MPQLEFDILSKLYFIEAYDRLLEEVNASPNEIRDGLRNLLGQQYVAAFVFDFRHNRFEQTAVYDTDSLEEYFFGATQKGIKRHSEGAADA
jgi:hypothetical protein